MSRVKSVSVRKIPDEMTGRMEVVRNHKYNKALRYWTLERCGIKTKGNDEYHICDRHEWEIIEKKLEFNRARGILIETHEFKVPRRYIFSLNLVVQMNRG